LFWLDPPYACGGASNAFSYFSALREGDVIAIRGYRPRAATSFVKGFSSDAALELSLNSQKPTVVIKRVDVGTGRITSVGAGEDAGTDTDAGVVQLLKTLPRSVTHLISVSLTFLWPFFRFSLDVPVVW
jgi:hypothetical protein